MNSIRRLLRIGSVPALLAAAGCIPAGQNSPMDGSPLPGSAFPNVVGINLQGKEIPLPEGFTGRLNLVAVAFRQSQQPAVDTWIEHADDLLARYDGFRFYEVPTIYQANALFRLWVNNGMRSGIQDPAARERTITIYVDRPQFLDALAIPSIDDIHLFLVDGGGSILWREKGTSDSQKLHQLTQAIEELSARLDQPCGAKSPAPSMLPSVRTVSR